MITGTMADSDLIILEKVVKTFPPPVPGGPPITVLGGADLVVKRGELVLVEGCSGSGKTTLLGLAGLLWRPTVGRVLWKGRDVGRDSQVYRNRLRRQHLGFVFQDYHLFERMTAWESIALPLRVRGYSTAQCRKRALALMHRLGLEGRENHRTEQLSGGERQRIAVARAVSAAPDLIIADEPISNADPGSAELIRGLLDQSRTGGAGLLVASHDQRFRESAHRRLHLGGAGSTGGGAGG